MKLRHLFNQAERPRFSQALLKLYRLLQLLDCSRPFVLLSVYSTSLGNSFVFRSLKNIRFEEAGHFCKFVS